MISIIDYGAGNLRSVQNTLAEIGAAYRLIDSATEIQSAEKLVLPGVGHFGQMMGAIDAMRIREPILAYVRSGKPFFGICVGMQGLFEGSEEAEGVAGLGIIPGRLRRFGAEARVPHMGWNEIRPAADSRLLANLGARPFVYFANSYYAPVVPEAAATCDYTISFSAAVENKNVFGVQFHPEKSGPLGLSIMRNFTGLPNAH
ncbi:MAG: imidazole glycerol phosphate synthase subunit HisH [Bryobacteraceae bacterium]|nr:imidazole glycerol phosphate synthase subunit HisH [Bryobacteraceae bacterium]